jgi:TRAP-type mannitol/chloroaromatic compound transport system substrate-binding protein
MANRKQFLQGLAAGTIALPVALRLLLGEAHAEQGDSYQVSNGQRYDWKMVTTWPPGFPILGEGCELLATLVKKMSAGRLNIEVFGGGELVPALEAFNTVSSGGAEMGSGSPYYWAGKVPGAQFFSGYPFGLNAQQMNAWLLAGGGLELWRELYAKHNLVPFIGGNTGVQMGGWYNREINSVADFKGLKMRMPGLGGRVLEALGGTPVLLAGGELYTGLERGVIDATEWVGPYHDYIMGFHEIAKYYYYPGWHEPGTAFEFFVNKDKYDELPLDLQTILEVATHYINMYTLSAFEAKNAEYLEKLRAVPTLSVRPFPDEVIIKAKAAATETIADFAAGDPFAQKVYEQVVAFKKRANDWGEITERIYYNRM